METFYKEVYFSEWCPKCKYYENSESEDPCWDCLDKSCNINSHKPTQFKEKSDE